MDSRVTHIRLSVLIVALASVVGCQSSEEPRRSASTADSSRLQSSRTDQEVAVPTAKEELKVGKREVQEGSTKLQKRTIEKPVQEQVQLRDENVTVERRPANRPVKDPEKAFQNQTIEMTQTKEEPVVAKETRQTGEVALKKQTQQRTETVRDTVRQTDVDVIDAGQQQARGMSFSSLEPTFRQHYASHYQNAGDYEQYRPAYRYGYQLSQETSGNSWSAIEQQAHINWDASQGPWEQYKEAVKYGWEQGRQRKG